MPADALRIRGRHNAVNALAALALATAAGCQLGPMLYGLREYRGEPHRVEPVGIVNDIEYFDDSKGTNVGATVAALQGLGAERKLVVILGGDGKGQDFAPLAAPVARFARAAVLIGRDAPLIRAVLEPPACRCWTPAPWKRRCAWPPSAPRRRRRADVAGLRQLRHVPQLRAPRRGVPRRGAGAGRRSRRRWRGRA
jgi:UDP-N-acetylmuramoylalanine-D-glutamate ligase